MKPHKMRSKILEDNITKVLLILAAPIIFNQLIQIIYNLTDTFWLGRLGRSAVSAPVVSWPIIFTITMFGSGFASAGLSLVSQYVGANKWEKVDKIVGNLLMYLFLISVTIGVIGFFESSNILRLMRVPADVFPLANMYLKIMFIFLPSIFIGSEFSMVLRSIGDTMTPMKVNVSALLMNVVLDPILIFGLGPFPEMGVIGAALATAISNLFASIIGVIILSKGWKHIHVRLKHLKLEKSIIRKITNIGLPAAFGNSLNGLAFSTIMAMISGFGSVAVAAYGISMRIINIISAVAFGISQAASIMIGQNIGAEQYSRAKKILRTAIKITFFTMVVLSVVIFFSRNELIRIFISDSSVVKMGSIILMYFSLSIPFFGVFFPVMHSLRAAGKTKISAALSFVRLWIFRVGSVYLLTRIFGVMGVWYGIALSNVMGGIVSLYFIFDTRWMKKIIE